MTAHNPHQGINIGAAYSQDIALSARIECQCCTTVMTINLEMCDSAAAQITQAVHDNGWRSAELHDEIFTTICPHCINTLDKGDDDE